MWELLTEASTFKDYPAATIVHWLQGLAAGWCYVHGHHRQNTSARTYAIFLVMLFLAYEISEQAGIGDKGWEDILNFGFMMHLSAAVTAGYYALRKRIGRGCKPRLGPKESS